MSDEDGTSSPPPSQLGTQNHWDSVYRRELTNFTSNKSDPGDIWYGEKAQSDMIRFGTDLLLDFGKSVEDVNVLDLGAGNGCLTLALLEEDYANIVASDYVQSSVDLSKSVCANGGFEESGENDAAIKAGTEPRCTRPRRSDTDHLRKRLK